jgi:hypothetical protein
MLRLEYPQTADEAINDEEPGNETVDILKPANWLRQMAQQQQQAQRDLQRLRQVCGGQFNRDDRRIRAIERQYTILFNGMRYIYEQAKSDCTASPEWLQTELMAVAQAAQAFTDDVWETIIARNEDPERAAQYHVLQSTRINDAVVLLRTADLERNQEQQQFRTAVQRWAGHQQATAEQLATTQERLRNEVQAAHTAEQPPTTPSFLQGAPAPRPPISRVPPAEVSATATVGGSREEPLGEREAEPRAPPPIQMDDNQLEREDLPPDAIARAIADGFTRLQARAAPAAAPAERTNTARLKMADPEKYDGKPKTPFRPWWDSVEEYFSFYPETAGRQRIAWVGALLTDEAKEWHQARRRLLGANDTWNAYSEAIQGEYLDPREGATAYAKLKTLRYAGDVKAYLTTFRALNIHAGSTGEGLKDIIDQAMPNDIVDMRFAQNRGIITNDEDFLVATYEAGRHVERLRALRAAKSDATGRSGGPGSGGGSKVATKTTTRVDKRDTVSYPPRSDRYNRNDRGPDHWPSMMRALEGVPQAAIDEHKKDPEACLRCGRKGHRARECYATATTGGLALPAAQRSVAAIAGWKRDAEDPVEAEESCLKAARTAAVVTEEQDRTEAPPLWATTSDDEEDF